MKIQVGACHEAEDNIEDLIVSNLGNSSFSSVFCHGRNGDKVVISKGDSIESSDVEASGYVAFDTLRGKIFFSEDLTLIVEKYWLGSVIGCCSNIEFS